MKHAKYYFKKYHAVEVLYFTTDDMAFTDVTVAKAHSLTLDDDLIIPITRKEAKAAMRDMVNSGWHAEYADNEQY